MSRPPRSSLVLAGLVAGAVLLLVGCGSTVVSPVAGSKYVTTVALPSNPTAGKVVFLSPASGCGACHTFKAAGTTGKVGPDLDSLTEYAAKANQPIESFTKAAIDSPPAAYVPPGYPTNAMPTNFGTTLGPQKIADLVAFLTQNQSAK